MPGIEQLTGETLGEYQIERLLGKSQLGAAYLAQQPTQGHTVLVTMFHFPKGMTAQEREQYLARFSQEGAALTHLAHPHILPIYAFGEQSDMSYLVAAFVKEASLAQVLKQNTRCTPQQTLQVLKQVATALDYAHSRRVTHGMLSLANVVVGNRLNARIAGFGLRSMLEMHSQARSARPQEYLASAQGVFLGNAPYISPEHVLGQPIDARTDIYTLGIMLFELLSGTQPFHGSTPLDTALQRLQQPVPRIHDICPDLPKAFDLVIGRALERDPTKRFQHAGDVASAFERVVQAQEAARHEQAQPNAPITLPPMVNWFDEHITPSGKWQMAPQVGTVSTPTTSPASTPARAGQTAQENPASLAGMDPFVWWSSHASGRKTPPSTPATSVRNAPVRLARPRSRPDQPGRRRLVTLLVAGTAAAGALTVGGISFAHLIKSTQRPALVSNSAAGSITRTSTTPAQGGGTQKTPATPTAPTQQPTPKPPTHTGTVIGSTALAANSSRAFINPADTGASLLIRLATGNFVACERACTHQGIAVNYDPQSKMLICPAHGAIFDPQNGFAHVSGPGNGPLTSVAIRVNGDGTVTTR